MKKILLLIALFLMVTINSYCQDTTATLDTNGDGKIDTQVHYKDGIPVKGEADLDGDGKVETWFFYSNNWRTTKVEQDTNGDGNIDSIDLISEGKSTYDTNYDGIFDSTSVIAENGSYTDVDFDDDGIIDKRFFKVSDFGKWVSENRPDFNKNMSEYHRKFYLTQSKIKEQSKP